MFCHKLNYLAFLLYDFMSLLKSLLHMNYELPELLIEAVCDLRIKLISTN